MALLRRNVWFNVALLGSVACQADLPPWSPDTVVVCGAEGRCPRGSTCDVGAGRCVQESAAIEREPPSFLTPSDQSVVDVGQVLVAWRPVRGASTYFLDVSTTSDFATLIGGSPFLLEPGRTDVSFAASEPVTHYLRLRADITEPGRYATMTLHALDDAVYVACAGGLEVCADDDTVGNRSSPKRTINGGLARALALGRSEVRVAGRGQERAYTETVLLSQGISLFGGYAEDFGANDPVAYPTIIQGTSPVTVVASGGVGGPARVEMKGFTVRGAGTEGSSALFVLYGDETIEVTNNRFENFAIEPPPSGNSTTAAVRIEARFSASDLPFVLEGNQVTSDRAGIRVRETNVVLRDNVVTIVPSPIVASRVGILVDGAVSQIASNQISVTTAGVGIQVSGSAAADLIDLETSTIVDNTVAMSNGRGTGIVAECCQRLRSIRRNVVTGHNTPGFRGMVLTGGTGVVARNVITASLLPTTTNDVYGLTRNFSAGIVVIDPTTLVGSDTYNLEANFISLAAFSQAEAYTDLLELVGVDVTYANQIPLFVTNNAVTLGVEPSGAVGLVADVSYGIRVTSSLETDQISAAAVVNNTSVLRATRDGTGVAISGRLATMYAVNNLLGFDALPTPSTTRGVSVGRWPHANIAAISSNAVAGAQYAFVTPSGSAINAELLTCPAFVQPPPPVEPVAWPLCSGNVSGPSSSELWSFDDLVLDVTLAPTSASPSPVRDGGVDTRAAQFGSVVFDIEGAARTCSASACYSIGATNP